MEITFICDWIKQSQHLGPIPAALYVAVDPAGIDGRNLEIYSDDGRGNGNLLLRIKLED